MEIESKMTEQNGTREYQVCLKDKVALLFGKNNTRKYLITLSDNGVLVERFFDKMEDDKDVAKRS